MIDAKEIMPFNFFKYGGIYSGDHKGMRYEIRRTGEKPDFQLHATVWPGPFCLSMTRAELLTVQDFDYSEEGREAAISWIAKAYESRREEWETVPAILDADGQLAVEEETRTAEEQEEENLAEEQMTAKTQTTGAAQ